jgi:HEAT repeat protein
MLFFDKQSALEKLQKHEYKEQEKLDLLDQVQEQNLPARDIIWMLTDHDSKIREVGSKLIVGDRSYATFQLLIKEMKNKEVLGRKYILPLLPRIDPEGLDVFLQKKIAASEVKDRSLAVEIISQFFRAERFIPMLLEAVHDPEQAIRYAATVKLCSYVKKNQEVFTQLFTMLYDETDRIRQRVIQEFCQIDAVELVEPFFARLPHEPKELQDKMIAALVRLAKKPELKLEEKVIPELASNNDLSRDMAARLLAEMPNKKEIIKKFLIYTRGIAFWLRERIFESLAKVTASIADAVLELLNDEAVRIDCMFLAAYIQDRRIIPGIVQILQSDVDWWIRVCAIDILLKFKAPDLIQQLRYCEKDPDLKWSVVSAYSELKAVTGLGFLKACLQDRSNYVRLEALRALAKFETAETNALIKEMAEGASDWALRTEAIRLAEALGITVKSKHEVVVDRVKEMASLKSLGFEMEDSTLNILDGSAEEIQTEEAAATYNEDASLAPERKMEEAAATCNENASLAPERKSDTAEPTTTTTRAMKFKFSRDLGLGKKNDEGENG